MRRRRRIYYTRSGTRGRRVEPPPPPGPPRPLPILTLSRHARTYVRTHTHALARTRTHTNTHARSADACARMRTQNSLRFAPRGLGPCIQVSPSPDPYSNVKSVAAVRRFVISDYFRLIFASSISCPNEVEFQGRVKVPSNYSSKSSSTIIAIASFVLTGLFFGDLASVSPTARL
jgi:hypothetical protein